MNGKRKKSVDGYGMRFFRNRFLGWGVGGEMGKAVRWGRRKEEGRRKGEKEEEEEEAEEEGKDEGK